MVFQVRAGYSVLGREIKVPQRFIPHVLRATIFGESAILTEQLNVLHFFTLTDPIDAALCNSLATVIDAWVHSDYVNTFSDHIRYTGVHVRGMNALVTGQATVTTNAGPGNVAGELLPLPTSLAVLFTTGVTGHGGHGEFHVFTASESVNDVDGLPSPAYQAAVKTAMDNLIVNTNVADFNLVVASFEYGTTKVVAGTEVSTAWGTVNSRKPKHGR